MAIRTDCINTALIELGQPVSVGIDSDTRQTVVSLRNIFEKRAKLLLEKYPWNFAKKVVQLTQVSGTVVGWDYRFNKPPACMRILKVTNREEQNRVPDIPFEEREGHVYTNHEETWLGYVDGTYASNDSGGWPEIVKDALALDLANRVAPSTDRSQQQRDDLRRMAYQAEVDARRWDAQQNKVDRPPLSEWQRNHISGRTGEHG